MDMTPEKYIEFIDEKFKEAMDKKMSRFDVEWGVWSHEMNRGIRIRVDSKDPESTRLKYVFVYWLLTSQLLELFHSGKKYIGRKKRIRWTKERQDIKKLVFEELNNDPWDLKDKDNPFYEVLSK